MAAESRTQASQMQGLGSLEEAVEALDPPGDKAKVLEVHASAFCPPLRFDYQPHEGDEVRHVAEGFMGLVSVAVYLCLRMAKAAQVLPVEATQLATHRPPASWEN